MGETAAETLTEIEATRARLDGELQELTVTLRAITDFEEARMLARRGDPGDAERALLRIDAAVRRFESIGMPGWVSRAQALRSDLEGR